MSILGDIGDIVWVIPVTAWFGRGWYMAWLQHQERKMELRLMRGESIDDRDSTEIVTLRKDLLALRDTSTQYDVSIDHTLQDLKERLAAMESRSYTGTASIPDQELENRNVLR